MNRTFVLLSFVLVTAIGWLATSDRTATAAPKSGPNISHDVFFTLKDDSPAARQALIDGCKKYLVDHDGVLFFSVGTLTKELNRPVNDRDFDVALHMVFRDRAAHDAYQVSPRHQDFVAANSDAFEKVRVFDSDVDVVPVK